MKGDFSRSTFDPEKNRTRVLMQQGRVLVDADWNEQVALAERLRRLALRDLVGTSGVPLAEPDSFLVTENGGQLEIEGGRIWVDGLLCEVDSIALDPAEIPDDAADEGGEGVYAVVLEAWERHLAAIEDPSIREVALGGPDTCTRTETVCRLRLVPAEGQSCVEVGPLDYGDGTGLLAARAVPPAGGDDPCVVPSQAGYTGLDNLLYRLEVHRGGDTADAANPPTFKWSRDNGSVLTALLEKVGTQLVVDSLGRDEVRGFHHAQWVELNQDGDDLACRPGPLVEVEGVQPAEDGEGGVLTIVEGDGSAAFVPDLAQHPKVRRWDSPALDIEADTWVALGEHNIEVRFAAGTYREGEYWWIPARAFVGEHFGSIEWPQTLGQPDDLSAHGPKKARARLALVQFDGADFQVLDDCRCVFPPLCQVEGAGDGCCCTVTVGDREGDVATIRDALAALPPEGGEICLRGGVHRESVHLDRSNVTFHGCGRRTVWMSDAADQPALTLGAVQGVVVKDLAFDLEGLGIVAAPGARMADLRFENLWVTARYRAFLVLPRVSGLEMVDCTVLYPEPEDPEAVAEKGVLEPAIFAGGRYLRLRNNRIRVDDLRSKGTPGVPGTPFGGIDDLVSLVPGPIGQPGVMPGGIQVAGQSQDVELSGNWIVGGAWHGVVLGSVSHVKFPDQGLIDVIHWRTDSKTGELVGEGVEDMQAHFAQLEIAPRRAPIHEYEGQRYLDAWFSEDNFGYLVSDGDLRDVRLLDNRIENMGGSGISAVHFFHQDDELPDLVGVDGLVLRGNRVQGCLRLFPWFEAFFVSPAITFGAVALSEVRSLVAEHNQLENNGLAWDPYPVCGAGVQVGRDLRFEGNRIVDNGSRPQEDTEPEDGRRGGIVIGTVTVGTYPAVVGAKRRLTGRRQDGVPALVVHDNVVVAPQGRALDVVAFGPVSITDNQLTAQGDLDLRTAFRSRGRGPGLGLDQAARVLAIDRHEFEFEDFRNVLGGAAVFVLDLGFSNELYLQAQGFSGFGRFGGKAPSQLAEHRDRAWIGGNVLFADNQVVLDGFSEGQTLPLSSITLLTLSDLAMHGNQSDCDLPPGELVLTNSLAVAMSLRVAENRFTEPIVGALLSSTSVGLVNRTTDNQGTHCFFAVGYGPISRMRPNEVLLEAFTGTGEKSPCFDLVKELGQPRKDPIPGLVTPTPGGFAEGPPAQGRVGGVIVTHQTPFPTLGKEQEKQLGFVPQVGDRLRLAGLDRFEGSLVSERARAAFTVLAVPKAEAPFHLDRFQSLDRAHVEAREEVFEQEHGVDSEGRLLVLGRLLGDRDSLPNRSKLAVVLSKVDAWQKPLAQAEPDLRRSRYALGVAPEQFVEYFTGESYLQLTLVVDGKPWASAGQEIGAFDQALRRVDITYGRAPTKGGDGSPSPRIDDPGPEKPRPKKPRPQRPRPRKPAPKRPEPPKSAPEAVPPAKKAPAQKASAKGKAGANKGRTPKKGGAGA